jgi:hypothetical protein
LLSSRIARHNVRESGVADIASPSTRPDYQLPLGSPQRPRLELAHPLAGEPQLAPDRVERLWLALKAEAALDDQPLPCGQPFKLALHRLPEKRPLCLLDGVTGSRDDEIGADGRQLSLPLFFRSRNGVIRSIGAGKTIVVACEDPSSSSVCR